MIYTVEDLENIILKTIKKTKPKFFKPQDQFSKKITKSGRKYSSLVCEPLFDKVKQVFDKAYTPNCSMDYEEAIELLDYDFNTKIKITLDDNPDEDGIEVSIYAEDVPSWDCEPFETIFSRVDDEENKDALVELKEAIDNFLSDYNVHAVVEEVTNVDPSKSGTELESLSANEKDALFNKAYHRYAYLMEPNDAVEFYNRNTRGPGKFIDTFVFNHYDDDLEDFADVILDISYNTETEIATINFHDYTGGEDGKAYVLQRIPAQVEIPVEDVCRYLNNPDKEGWKIFQYKLNKNRAGLLIPTDLKTYDSTTGAELESVELTEAPKPIKIDADTANSGLYGNTNFDMLDISRKNLEDEKHEQMIERGKQLLDEIKADSQFAEPDPTDKLEAFFEKLVPETGMADTIAGELVRATERLIYRNYNDGDFYYIGYGIETCGSSATYIAKINDDFYDLMTSIPEKCDESDSAYDSALKDLAATVIDYLLDNPVLFSTKNTVDSRQPTHYIDWSKYEPTYTLTIDYPEKLIAYLESGKIDYAEIRDEVGSWYVGNGDLSDYCSIWPNDTYVDLDDLPKTIFDEVVEWPDPLDSFVDTLDSIHGSPYEDVVVKLSDRVIQLADSAGIDIEEEMCDFAGIYAGDVNIEQMSDGEFRFEGIEDQDTYDSLDGCDWEDFEDELLGTYSGEELESYEG